MGKPFLMNVRVGIEGRMSDKQKERLLAFLQSKVDGLTYNIDQAIATFAGKEGIELLVGTWAFGGRTN